MKELTQKTELFSKDSFRAIEAMNHAHFIAFAPYVWEASKLLADKNILKLLEESDGLTIEEIAQKTNISHYGVRILLEAGLGIGLVYRKDDVYFLSKAGYFFITDKSIIANYKFMRDVCFEGARYLEESIETGKPEGLKTLGNWDTIYEGLSTLHEPAKSSWFEFDHYYSDITFDKILPIVFKTEPKSILDIGGNTGKWALKCFNYSPTVEVGLVDLGVQLKVAEKNITQAGFRDRAQFHEINMLDDTNKLPEGYDVIWMSQFLDCFSDDQILSILKMCHSAADEDTVIFINETFWDLQRFEASAFALQMTSLYFTTLANGNSQMYDSKVFFKLIDEAGFDIVEQENMIGMGHTLLTLKKKK